VKPLVKVLDCLIQSLPLLGYEHTIPYKWYQTGAHFLHKETPIRLVNCEYRLIGTVRLHRLMSCSIEYERVDTLGLAEGPIRRPERGE
jgi:hypothetical protein